MKKNFKKITIGLCLALMLSIIPGINALALNDAGEGGGGCAHVWHVNEPVKIAVSFVGIHTTQTKTCYKCHKSEVIVDRWDDLSN